LKRAFLNDYQTQDGILSFGGVLTFFSFFLRMYYFGRGVLILGGGMDICIKVQLIDEWHRIQFEVI